MPVLTQDQKVFIVMALAQFDTPSIVATKVRECYDVDVPRPQIALYDPTTHTGRKLSKPLRRVFEDSRKKFLESVENIGIANQAVRLKLLDEAASKSRDSGDTKGVIRCRASNKMRAVRQSR